MSSIYKTPDGERAVHERYRQFLTYWPVANRQFHVPTREGETFVIASGREDAPPLVLLHGSGFNSVTWMGDVTSWSAHFRVYAVDVIGHPGLSAPSRPRYDSDAYARWIDDVLQALAIDRTAIVGISLGGWLGIDYATRRSERVSRLVVLSPGGVGRERIGTFRLMFTILPLLLLGQRGRRKAMEKMLGPTPMLDSDETKARLEAHAADVQVRYLPEVGHAVVGQTAPILEFLLS